MIEIVFGGSVAPDDAVLIEGDAAAPTAAAVARFIVPANPLHGVGCSCCAPRGPASEALSRLYLARARGETPMFRRVVVLASDAGVALVRAALAGDAVTRARFGRSRLSSD
jgi:hypothetical protein